jgi:hypothetical protein
MIMEGNALDWIRLCGIEVWLNALDFMELN